MDQLLSIGQMTELFKIHGLSGILIVIWFFTWLDNRQLQKEIGNVMRQYGKDQAELRSMYENNVKLVKGYEALAGDFKDMILLNTQVCTRLTDKIDQNQFCPLQRFEKRKVEVAR